MESLSEISQALIAVGGRAKRLRESKPDLPPFLSKSFLHFNGKPALYWTLKNLRQAGIARLILAAEKDTLLEQGKHIALEVGFAESNVILYRDLGEGVHGLPYHTRHVTDQRFIFEAGHGMAPASHYRLLRTIPDDKIAYSTYTLQTNNDSRIILDESISIGFDGRRVVALPYCINKEWAHHISHARFSVRTVLIKNIHDKQVVFVKGSFQPEFDVGTEYETVQSSMDSLSDA